jgi:phage terminase small subunit
MDLFPRTPAYAIPNPQVEGDNEVVRDQIARTLREFGCTPKGRARSYQKPYPEYFGTIPCPRGFRVPDLAKFVGDDAKTTYEHIWQFLAQVNDVGITDVHKIRMFPLSLIGAAFN